MTTALVPALQSNWLVMHVTVMMLSYGALLAGCLLAICYLIVAFFSPRLSLAQTEKI
jgi:ABC-type transport system involved in cytochrome c biogenesis permease subunit